MQWQRFYLIVLFGSLACCVWIPCRSQQKSDSSRTKQLVSKLKNTKTTRQVLAAFSRKMEDTTFNVKSEDAYLPYEGKIIRNINIEHIDFDRTVIDTTHTFQSRISNIANHLHTNSRDWVIRNNLFIRKGDPLNSYRTADNERFLRDRDFILDARIFVKPIPGSDSVDLLVVTRDVFSLGVYVTPGSTTNYKFKLQEANLLGMGQRVEFTQLYDIHRDPRNGTEMLYRKNNVAGSFIDATLDYTQLNTGSSLGNENEKAMYLRLNRPLFMPYTRWAGGLELSKNQSTNVNLKPDSAFANYHYNIQDLWAGYSFGHQKKKGTAIENRNRKFFALRAFDQHFLQLPVNKLTTGEQFYYRNRRTFLGQLTFFKQDFYKTQYVLGFGRTEDIPYGYRISFTGGMEKELNRQRPYADAEIYHNFVGRSGAFFTYNVKLASYYYQKRAEEGIILFDVTRYSQIYKLGKFKIRHQIEGGYSRQFNQVLKRQLDINDVNGITGFHADSVMGNRRMIFNTQLVLFTPWKLLGFKLAPETRLDLTYLAKQREYLFQDKNFFSGILLGLRARNENLIFNTIEARVIYYPRTDIGMSHFRFDFRTNIRIKYPTTLVNAPATFYDPSN